MEMVLYFFPPPLPKKEDKRRLEGKKASGGGENTAFVKLKSRAPSDCVGQGKACRRQE